MFTTLQGMFQSLKLEKHTRESATSFPGTRLDICCNVVVAFLNIYSTVLHSYELPGFCPETGCKNRKQEEEELASEALKL